MYVLVQEEYAQNRIEDIEGIHCLNRWVFERKKEIEVAKDIYRYETLSEVVNRLGVVCREFNRYYVEVNNTILKFYKLNLYTPEILKMLQDNPELCLIMIDYNVILIRKDFDLFNVRLDEIESEY